MVICHYLDFGAFDATVVLNASLACEDPRKANLSAFNEYRVISFSKSTRSTASESWCLKGRSLYAKVARHVDFTLKTTYTVLFYGNMDQCI